MRLTNAAMLDSVCGAHMQSDELGRVIETFRTSRTQAVVLFVVAALLAGVAGFLYSIDDRTGNLLPVTLIAAAGAIYMIGWGAKLAVPVMQICERGVSLRFLVRRIHLPFDQIETVGVQQRTRNGLPGPYSGVWLKRRDGSVLVFPLESHVPEAASLIGQFLGR
jgi:hypothetical protein